MAPILGGAAVALALLSQAGFAHRQPSLRVALDMAVPLIALLASFLVFGRLRRAAVLEERRRIARDLHDGLAQELAYLARNLDSLGGDVDQDTLRRLRWAAERAQREARRAVGALATPDQPGTDVAVAQAAGEVAERFHVALDLAVVPGIRLPPDRAEALTRIAREAVTNAARHSGASRVRLGLDHDGSRVRLRVRDSGRGFNTTLPGGGFGLISMRERARSVGGELRISSSPGEGSEVEAAL